MLSVVEKRCDKRLLSEVLDHAPTHADLRAFLERWKTALTARDLPRCGVTTEGSALSPAPRREVCGDLPPHIGTFPSLAASSNAVVGAMASARQGLAATPPTRPKGRPSTQAATAAARTKQRLAEPCAAWFTQRSLCVQRHRNKTERKTLWRIRRGWPQ